MDPALDENGKQTKGGFDMTAPFGVPDRVEYRRSDAPGAAAAAGAASTAEARSVREMLQSGPKYFIELMDALHSRDGREVVLELERLRQENSLNRTPNGQWCLAGTPGSQPASVPPEVALKVH
jgi:hypothetical protein